MTTAENELLLGLRWLLRVSQGIAHDDDDVTDAHLNAEKLIAKYDDTEDTNDDLPSPAR
jgi:hypothetical protein